MSASAFVDSNVLIYVIEHEGANVSKAAVARDMIERVRPTLSTEGLGRVLQRSH